jgi:hypothetical protein
MAVVPSAFAAAFPAGPMVDANGEIMPAWRGFLLQLFNRTGGSPGSNAATSTTALAAETAARIAADLVLTTGEAHEATTRAAADAAEATARAATDATLAARIGNLASTIGATGGAPVTPLMDGTASTGLGPQLARADHVHPSDTTRQTAAQVVVAIAAGNPGAFTTLAASGTVSGAGFTALLASPPAIGGTAPAAGSFLALVGTSVGVGASGPTWTSGSAAPSATAPVGSLYSRVGGAVGATLYVSRGSGTWAAVAGV